LVNHCLEKHDGQHLVGTQTSLHPGMTHKDPVSTKTDRVHFRKPIVQWTRTKRLCGTQTAKASRTTSVLHCVLLVGLATDLSSYFDCDEWLLRNMLLETRLSRLCNDFFLSLHLMKYLFSAWIFLEYTFMRYEMCCTNYIK
jgi:hypothetical protein